MILRSLVVVFIAAILGSPLYSIGVYMQGGGAVSWIKEGEFRSQSVSGVDITLGALLKNPGEEKFIPFVELESVRRGYTIEDGKYGELFFNYINLNSGYALMFRPGKLLAGLRLGLGFDNLVSIKEEGTGYDPDYMLTLYDKFQIGLIAGGQLGFNFGQNYTAGVYLDYYWGLGKVYRTEYSKYVNRSLTYGFTVTAFY